MLLFSVTTTCSITDGQNPRHIFTVARASAFDLRVFNYQISRTMSSAPTTRVKRVMTQAIHLMFEYLKNVRFLLLVIGELLIHRSANRKKEFRYGYMKILGSESRESSR